MLETKMAELSSQLSALTIVVERLITAMSPASALDAPAVLVVDAAPRREKPSVKPAPEPNPTPIETPAITVHEEKVEVVSIDTLRDMCMAIVRADGGKKPVVKNLIFSFGRAQKVQDVPVADRLALLTALEQI
tara:strand:+ start:18366 stop:18764 length:399 start_codon:yes stop_codon:yes gene_type:complete